MKGGIGSMVFAAETLARLGVRLGGDLVVCTNTDEESSGAGGIAACSTACAPTRASAPSRPGSRCGRQPRLADAGRDRRGPARARRADAAALARGRRGERDREAAAWCSTRTRGSARSGGRGPTTGTRTCRRPRSRRPS